jgi:hypothetical protein
MPGMLGVLLRIGMAWGFPIGRVFFDILDHIAMRGRSAISFRGDLLGRRSTVCGICPG